MRCKDCMHYAVCKAYNSYFWEDVCGHFKPTSRFYELPCEVGQSCYPLPHSRKPIVERKVSRITFSARNIIIGYYENDGQYRPPLRTRVLGVDVFLSREEAEKALAERSK